MINGQTYIGRGAETFTRGDAILPVTHVIINYGENDSGALLTVEAKLTPDNGRTVEKTLETITDAANAQLIADAILYQYDDDIYEAMAFTRGALDPAAELGDAVTVNDIYTMVGEILTTFDAAMLAEVNSVGIEVIDDFPYGYKTKAERKVERDYSKNYAAIRTNATQIEAVVGRQTEVEGRVENISTTITQTADEINATVAGQRATLEASINSERVRIDGVISDLDDHARQQAKFIEYSTTDGLTLGSGGSKKKAQLTDDALTFFNASGAEAASIGSGGLYMRNTAHVDNELELGDHWSLVASSDNHLTIKWRT